MATISVDHQPTTSTRRSGSTESLKKAATEEAQRRFIEHPSNKRVKSEILKRLQQEPEPNTVRGRVRAVMTSTWFDLMMGSVIFSNMIVMVFEIDRSTLEVEPNSSHWTETFGWIVLPIFIVELLARLYAWGCDFWIDKWNKFDFVIVSIDTVFSLVSVVAGDLFPISVLRIFRLAKLARISKVMRLFPELRLLIAGIVCSMSAIFWGIILLVLALLVWAMVAVLFIHPLAKDVNYDGCARCSRAYSSVLHASLTFWQTIITGDSWGQSTIPVIEKHPFTAIFFVTAYLSLGMAVMNLILGVVVSVAQQAKESIEASDQREQIILKAEQTTKLLGLCIQMDVDNDGVISQAEFCEAYDCPGEFREALDSLDITRDEIDIVWKVLSSDSKSKEGASYEDVVSALYAVKTSDQEFMLHYIKHYITLMKETLMQTLSEQRARTDTIASNVEQARREIAEVEALEFGTWQRLNDDTELPNCFRTGAGSYPASVDTSGVAKLEVTNGEDLASLNQKGAGTDPAHVDTSRVLKLEVTDGEQLVWLKPLSHRIAKMRIELGDILMDMKGKFEPLTSPLSRRTAGMTSVEATAGSQVLIDETVSGIPRILNQPSSTDELKGFGLRKAGDLLRL